MTGLLIAGRLVEVLGLKILPPASHGGPEWCRLDPRDYRQRPRGTWIRQIIVHTTKGAWPQRIVDEPAPGGRDKVVADFWRGDPAHSAAHLVVDSDGTVACLCDLAWTEAYHAEGSNPWSVGIELYQEGGGVIRRATLDAGVRLVLALCAELGIPPQIHSRAYAGEPLDRMEVTSGDRRRQLGGPDCVGIFGHRDNTNHRGQGDPGDAFYDSAITAGAEPFDFSIGRDLAINRLRQAALNARGDRLAVDGLVGSASLSAARRHGFCRWLDVPVPVE